MGSRTDQFSTAVGQITAGDSEAVCEVCGSTQDVAQVIGTVEGPDPEMGGLATITFICSRCAAYIIQVTTGFRAVKTLDSWYYIRGKHKRYRAGTGAHSSFTGEPIE